MAHVANRAESLGYHELWTFQRLLSAVDDSWGEVYRRAFDPLTTLGYAAALTNRIRLGAAVVNMPFVTPVLLGEAGGDCGRTLGWAVRSRARPRLVR